MRPPTGGARLRVRASTGASACAEGSKRLHGSERQRESAAPLRYRHHGSEQNLRNATPTSPRAGACTQEASATTGGAPPRVSALGASPHGSERHPRVGANARGGERATAPQGSERPASSHISAPAFPLQHGQSHAPPWVRPTSNTSKQLPLNHSNFAKSIDFAFHLCFPSLCGDLLVRRPTPSLLYPPFWFFLL